MTRFSAPISEQIWDMKYRFKKADGTPIDETVEDTWDRMADALVQPEKLATGKTKKNVAAIKRQFQAALEDFKYLPAGRITAGAGTARTVTLFNCFVMGTVPDSMSGIFDMLKEAALTMQQGGGIGYDFSTIRPKSSWVRGVDSDASGPLSFMDCWDAMCRTVMSAGSRRGAMMATMRCDHPDIEDFITAKQDAARLRMFNLSVLATDAFMEAVKADEDWPLVHSKPPARPEGDVLEHMSVNGLTEYVSLREDGKFVHKIVRARDLWNLIIRSTYAQAEPGVIFIDRINEANNLRYCETIAATNPCGEQPLPPYGACLLGSINLARLVQNPFTDEAHIDGEELDTLVASAVRMMDNVVDVSNFPLPQQEEEAKNKRRIGLGVTGVADALAMMKLKYGTDAAAARVDKIMGRIDQSAYRASVKLAEEKGAFPLFNVEEYLAPGTHASTLPRNIQEGIREYGIRNALLTSIAPTGTISLYAGNVSSGIEPIFAYSYVRKVLQKDGSHTEELVEDYAVAKYREYWQSENPTPHGYPEEAFDPDKHLPDYFVTAQTLMPRDHLVMQAAAQKHVDSSISKTINCPEDITFEDFEAVYLEAYELGCKGCTTYRPNDITGSVLSVEPKKEEAPDPAQSRAEGMEPEAAKEYYNLKIEATGNLDRAQVEALVKAGMNGKMPHLEPGSSLEVLPQRPEELEGSTYKIKVGDQKTVYLTINDIVESDGTVRPFEVFLRSSDPTHDEWMVAIAQLISAVMRRPHDASFIGPRLMRIASAVSGGYQKGHGYQPSLVAAIGRQIKAHAERTSMMVQSDMKWPSPTYAGTKTEDYDFDLDDNIPDFPQAAPKGSPCPDCGSFNSKLESGCLTCTDCGYSKCG